ncbi:MAG: hypothetical protein LH630_05055 [Actinomycetia bacterium]|nr:hypothetical protein [Actinomycetes bacterium]
MPDYLRVYDEGAKRHFSAVVGSTDAETLKVTDDALGDYRAPTDQHDNPLDVYGNPVKKSAAATTKKETS